MRLTPEFKETAKMHEYCCPKGQEPAAMQKMSDAAAAQETK